MAVFVLGAGATRGASFVNPSERLCLPPLDSDFYTQLQRISSAKQQQLVRNVVKDTSQLFGNNFSVTMETVFTTLEHTIRMERATGKAKASYGLDFVKMRNDLMQAIAALFEESLCDGLRMRDCEYHKKLVSQMKPGDVIVSFNYDCLIDNSLRCAGDRKWNAKFGYGLPLRRRGQQKLALQGGHEHWSPKSPAPPRKTVYLYKLHGSLHFRLTNNNRSLILKKQPYTRRKGRLHFAIIPPESDKRYDEGFFRKLWTQARDALHKAETLVLVGYSLPASDQHSTALFRVAVREGRLKSLVVVNPDREARRRIRGVVQSGLGPESRVYSFDTLAEFAGSERALWDPYEGESAVQDA